MGLADRIERRLLQGIVKRYLQAYDAYIFQLRPFRHDGRPVELDLGNWWSLHRRAHITAMRAYPGARQHELLCEVSGVRSIARNHLGVSESEFLWDLGWAKWHESFARSTRLLGEVLKEREKLSIPQGDEPYWVVAWAFGIANLTVKWIAAYPEMLQMAQERIEGELPALIGRTHEEVSEWFASPRAVRASAIEDQLFAAGLDDLLIRALRE